MTKSSLQKRHLKSVLRRIKRASIATLLNSKQAVKQQTQKQARLNDESNTNY